jgi:hypothetical protein
MDASPRSGIEGMPWPPLQWPDQMIAGSDEAATTFLSRVDITIEKVPATVPDLDVDELPAIDPENLALPAVRLDLDPLPEMPDLHLCAK